MNCTKPALHEGTVYIIVFVGSQPSETMAGRKGEWQQCNEFKFAFGLSHCFFYGSLHILNFCTTLHPC